MHDSILEMFFSKEVMHIALLDFNLNETCSYFSIANAQTYCTVLVYILYNQELKTKPYFLKKIIGHYFLNIIINLNAHHYNINLINCRCLPLYVRHHISRPTIHVPVFVGLSVFHII